MNNLVSCPICQSEFKSLMSHIRLTHNLTPTELLEKYPNAKMVSDTVKKKASQSCVRAGCGRTPGFTVSEEQKRKISNSVTGEKNPFYGKHHSKKTRRQMSRNHADFGGANNPLVKWLNSDPQNRIAYSDGMKRWMAEKWSNEEYRKKHSERLSRQVSQQHIDGFNPYSNCEHGWFHSNKFATKFYFQSSYERRFLEFCEKSQKISSLQRVSFVIPYQDDNGICRNYCADFLVNKDAVIEIKPQSMLNYNNNREKIAAGKSYCENNGYDYKLLMENELNDLENVL